MLENVRNSVFRSNRTFKNYYYFGLLMNVMYQQKNSVNTFFGACKADPQYNFGCLLLLLLLLVGLKTLLTNMSFPVETITIKNMRFKR